VTLFYDAPFKWELELFFEFDDEPRIISSTSYCSGEEPLLLAELFFKELLNYTCYDKDGFTLGS
jgi:hypothetical protein